MDIDSNYKCYLRMEFDKYKNLVTNKTPEIIAHENYLNEIFTTNINNFNTDVISVLLNKYLKLF